MEALRYKVMSASGLINANLMKYTGFYVSTTTATAAILIKDGASSSGTVIDTIPSGTAAGFRAMAPYPIMLNTGLYVDFNGGTGTIVVLFE